MHGQVWAAREYLNPSQSSPAGASPPPFYGPARGVQPLVQRCDASPRLAMATQLRDHAEQGLAQIAQVVGAAHLAQAGQHGLAVRGGNVAECGHAALAQDRGVRRGVRRAARCGRGCRREQCENRRRDSGLVLERHDEIYFRGVSLRRLAPLRDTSAGAFGAGRAAVFRPPAPHGSGWRSLNRDSASHVTHCAALVSGG